MSEEIPNLPNRLNFSSILRSRRPNLAKPLLNHPNQPTSSLINLHRTRFWLARLASTNAGWSTHAHAHMRSSFRWGSLLPEPWSCASCARSYRLAISLVEADLSPVTARDANRTTPCLWTVFRKVRWWYHDNTSNQGTFSVPAANRSKVMVLERWRELALEVWSWTRL